jgi:hypothetical protein
MRHFLFAVIFSAAAFAQTPLAAAKNVFLTPMPGGLEQYLALHLTQASVLQVVTDSTKADVVFTDRIGEDLQTTLADLENKPKAAQSGKAGEFDFAKPNMRPLSRARGTVFLVDRKSGDVLWSTLEQPKSSKIPDLDAAAKRIVDKLAKARAAKH